MSDVLTVDAIDLEDLDFWVGPRTVIEESFAALRAERPRAFFQEVGREDQRYGGYWALTRYRDIVEVSRRPHEFSSVQGVNIGDFPPALTEFFGSILTLDDPRHAQLRRIVARGFTPRILDALKADIEAMAAEIIGEVAEAGECDFVTQVAARLPLRVIIRLMGIPESEERSVADATNTIFGLTDSEYVPDQSGQGKRRALEHAGAALGRFVEELAQDRIRHPRDDLVTRLVAGGADGDNLTPQELASFFILLVSAGNETTRNAIAHGLLVLTDHPGQRARWQQDFHGGAPTAVEEILRWASPVLHMRRTVLADGVRLGDQEFTAGDKVVLWYYSANRDEDVFVDGSRFDIARQPNDHIAFGHGPHFCLGAHLARREITVVFQELFRQLPDIRAVGEPEWLRSNFVHAIKHLRAEFTPRRSSTPG